MKGWLGFDKWFDFSHEHTFAGKLKNLGFAFCSWLLWGTAMSILLFFLAGFTKMQLQEILSRIFAQSALYKDVMNLQIGDRASSITMFFLACVLAPLWEETVFRVIPIKIGKLLTKLEEKLTGQNSNLLFWVCVFSSIIFGLGHGSVMNILFQGVGGFMLCWLYLKNKGYWWNVALHSLWNFMVIFGLPIFMHQ